MATFRIKQNLFLKGNKVISYTTHVATIKKNQLHELGKFSRTTTKQLQFLCRILNLEYVPCSIKKNFSKYEMGVQCHIKDAIKFKILKTIRKLQDEDYSYPQILAIIKEDCTSKEWTILSKGVVVEPELIKGSQLLKRFQLI